MVHSWHVKLKKMSEPRLWGFDDEQRAVLVSATTELAELAELAALVQRATRHEEIAGLWIVRATGHELDEVYSLVEALEHGAGAKAARAARGDADVVVHVDRRLLTGAHEKSTASAVGDGSPASTTSVERRSLRR